MGIMLLTSVKVTFKKISKTKWLICFWYLRSFIVTPKLSFSWSNSLPPYPPAPPSSPFISCLYSVGEKTGYKNTGTDLSVTQWWFLERQATADLTGLSRYQNWKLTVEAALSSYQLFIWRNPPQSGPGRGMAAALVWQYYWYSSLPTWHWMFAWLLFSHSLSHIFYQGQGQGEAADDCWPWLLASR